MLDMFIVNESFKHDVECFCTETRHTNTITFRKGNRIELTNHTRYIDEIGFFVQIVINDMYTAFLHENDIEELYNHQYFRLLLDVELEANYYEFKINEALDAKEEETFRHYVSLLEHHKELLEEEAVH